MSQLTDPLLAGNPTMLTDHSKLSEINNRIDYIIRSTVEGFIKYRSRSDTDPKILFKSPATFITCFNADTIASFVLIIKDFASPQVSARRTYNGFDAVILCNTGLGKTEVRW